MKSFLSHLIVLASWIAVAIKSFAAPFVVDTNYNVLIQGGAIYTAATASDGKLVIGGTFSAVASTPRNGLARLQSNGVVDDTFDVGQGPNSAVNAVSQMSGGGLLVSGAFSSFNGVERRYIVKLRNDGSFDPSFPKLPFGLYDLNSPPVKVLPDPDGRIYIVGGFMRSAETGAATMLRITKSGEVDDGFHLDKSLKLIFDFDFAPDGGLILAGVFPDNIALIKVDETGAVVESFKAPSLDNGSVSKVSVDTAGNSYAIGDFTSIDGYSRKEYARFTPNGSLDTGFKIASAYRGTYLIPYHAGAGSLFIDGDAILSILDQSGSPLFSSGFDSISKAWDSPDGSVFFYSSQSSIRKIAAQAIPPAPILKGTRVFAVEVTGNPGNNYRLDYKSSLNSDSWNVLTNITLSSGSQYFFDLSSTNAGMRYYRAVGP